MYLPSLYGSSNQLLQCWKYKILDSRLSCSGKQTFDVVYQGIIDVYETTKSLANTGKSSSKDESSTEAYRIYYKQETKSKNRKRNRKFRRHLGRQSAITLMNEKKENKGNRMKILLLPQKHRGKPVRRSEAHVKDE